MQRCPTVEAAGVPKPDERGKFGEAGHLSVGRCSDGGLRIGQQPCVCIEGADLPDEVEHSDPQGGCVLRRAAHCLDPLRRPTLGRDDQSSDTVVDVITEEQLLRGMESLTPTEPSANGGSGRG